MVFASSAAVYGDCPTLPIPEGAERRPLSAYGADKYGSELHAAAATHVHGIPTVGLRFFNVYGPRQDPKSPYSGVISIFRDCILKGAPITIHGDGGQTRDFVHVSDVVEALLAGMALRPDSASIFNVCTGAATSIAELVQVIGHLAGKNPDVRHGPPRTGEIRHSLGDPSAMRHVLGLTPRVALRDGLRSLLIPGDAGSRPC